MFLDSKQTAIRAKMAELSMMEEKWRIVFKLMDINKDGRVTSEDKEFCKSVFSGLSSTDGSPTQLSDLDYYWDNMVFPGESPSWDQDVSEDQFLRCFTHVFTTDKGAAVKRVSESVKHLLMAADLDSSRTFTFDKFFKFHEAFNLAHEVIVRTTFNLIGPAPDDTCTFDQVHAFYVELFIGEDKGKFEALKTAYKALGML